MDPSINYGMKPEEMEGSEKEKSQIPVANRYQVVV